MRTAYPLTLAILLALASGATAQPLLTAYRTGTPPVLDGDLGDACWQEASVSSVFLSAERPGQAEAQTQVRVAWDEGHLYLGIEAFEPYLDPVLNMLHLVRAEQEGRTANVFTDDCVEVFLHPPGDDYYHFAANSGSGTYQARNQGEQWDCDWRSAARRGDRSYVVEMAIPLEALGARPEGEWRVNFARERTAIRELSTWSGLQGAFHQPQAFGRLAFRDAGPALGPVDIQREGAEVLVRSHIRGDAAHEPALRVEARTGDDVRVAHVTGTGAVEARVALPPAAMTTGRAEVTYTLLEGDQPRLISAPVPQTIAAAVGTLAVTARNADVIATLNGSPVQVADPGARLELRPGLNALALQARATGPEPAVRARLSVSGRDLPVTWLARAGRAEDLPADVPQEGWAPAAEREGGTWPAGDADEALLWCGLYVPEPGPALFPRMDTFYAPRGSRQLLRFYLPVPLEVARRDYRMVVEAPAGLRAVAVEPFGATAPDMTREETGPHGATPLTRHVLSYEQVPGAGMELSLRWGDPSGATLGYEPALVTGGTHDWRRLSATVKPPPGAVSVRPLIIKWQNRGITGTFWVDDVAFREADGEENLVDAGTFDEPRWDGRPHISPEGVDGSRCVKIAGTPDLVDRQQAVWVVEDPIPVDPDREYVIEADVRCESVASATSRPLCGLLLEAPADMPEGDLPLLTWFQGMGGAVTGVPRESRVAVLPPLKDVRPARARISPCYYGSRFSNPEVAEAHADNAWASGITWTYGRIGNDIIPRLLDRGHQVFLSIPWEPWHAIPGARWFLNDHPEVQAVGFDGRPKAHVFCPTWMLAEGERPLQWLEAWVLDLVHSAPYAAANWDVEQPVLDPPNFCVCDRCLDAFRAFAGMDADAPLAPEDLTAGRRADWVRFRCTQNAELAGHMRAILQKADRRIEFSIYSGYQSLRTLERYGVDWALMAPHLDLAIAGYNGDRAAIGATIEALGDVPFMGGEMWYLSDRDDSQAPPRMETWRNRILRQYVDSGCVGCLIWWLPPMEGGSFYATSEAAEIIATYEGFFEADRRRDDLVTVTGIEARNWSAFERDGELLVLLLSFSAAPVEAEVRVGEQVLRRTLAPFGAEVVVTKRP